MKDGRRAGQVTGYERWTHGMAGQVKKKNVQGRAGSGWRISGRAGYRLPKCLDLQASNPRSNG